MNFSDPYAYLTVGMAANKKLADEMGLKTEEDWNSSEGDADDQTRHSAPGETAARLFPKARVRQFDGRRAGPCRMFLNGNAHALSDL